MAVIFTDNFTEGSDTLLENHTSDSGGKWTRLWGSAAGEDLMVIAATDVCRNDGSANNGCIYTAECVYPSQDYSIQYTLSVLGIDPGDAQYMFVRVLNVDNFYAVKLVDQGGTNTCQLYKKVQGTWVALGSAFNPPANGSVCKLEIIGSSLKFYDDTVEVASATDTDIHGIGKAGIGAGGGSELQTSNDDLGSTPEVDTLTIDNLGTYSPPANFNKLRPAIFTGGIAR